VRESPNAFGDLDREIRGVGMASVVGPQTGAELLGATVYELSPGSRWADLHLHYANEEVLIVLAGTPILHTRNGDRELAVGEVLTFPRGREGAHRLENASDKPTRVLLVSTMNMPDIVEYPDSGKVFVMSEPPYTTGVHDPEKHGRLLRVFDRSAGKRVPPDE
jgi:uncharacterized cupin superfamily protein